MKIDARKLAAVDPGGWYTATEVGEMLGRSGRSCRAWCRAGKLAYRPDPIDPRQYLILGSAVQALAGELARTAAPAASESDTARTERGRAALADILRMPKRAGAKR